MTPDTAEFPRDAAWPSAKPWTEDEDGIIDAVRHLPLISHSLPSD